MLSFDAYLTAHAPELLRLELLFALLVIATGCGIALCGAYAQGRADTINSVEPMGVGKTPASVFAGRIAELSSRYGALCGFGMFTKLREPYSQH